MSWTEFVKEWKCNIPYTRHYNPLLIWNRSLILTIHKSRTLRKKPLEKTFLDFKKWVKSIQTASYKRARTVIGHFSFMTIASHWDFLPKFLSLHYYTTLEGALGVQRRGQGQRTIICLLGPLFFSQNGMMFKKTYKNHQNPVNSYCFFLDIFRVCSSLAKKQ